MAVSLQRVEGLDLPASYQNRNVDVAFKVTDANGEVFYVEDEGEAAAMVARLHEQDQDEQG